ncbi:MAG: N-6 DNA methylase [Pseudomonadota bacterium]|nr:N-6 DNA methylase [Pseudomonadota bacterium]
MNRLTHIAQELSILAQDFYQQGLTHLDYLTELTWLLGLKLTTLHELTRPEEFDWYQFIQQPSELQYQQYSQCLKTFAQLPHPLIAGVFKQAQTQLTQPQQLNQLIAALAVIDGIAFEDLAALYEMVLETSAHQPHSALYHPPQALVDVITVLIQPQNNEIIQDPLAGSGNFLVAAHEYSQVTAETSQIPMLIGIEPTLSRQRLALMNCLLHQLSSSQSVPILWGDSLLLNQHTWPQADVIISMLVFTPESPENRYQHNATLALLQRICHLLKPGGRAAVIVADNILNASGPAQQVRHILLETCRLHTILRLPEGVFYPHHITAQVIFFQRCQNDEEKTQDIWYYDLRTQVPAFGAYRTLKREQLRAFEQLYGDDPNGQAPRSNVSPRWQCISRAQLIEERLDYCALAQDSQPMTIDVGEIVNTTVEELEILKTLLQE